jgi:hypothetical protein
MKPATAIVSLILLVMATGHLVRTVTGWPVTIDGFLVPVWFSAVAAVAFALLAVMLFREQKA